MNFSSLHWHQCQYIWQFRSWRPWKSSTLRDGTNWRVFFFSFSWRLHSLPPTSCCSPFSWVGHIILLWISFSDVVFICCVVPKLSLMSVECSCFGVVIEKINWWMSMCINEPSSRMSSSLQTCAAGSRKVVVQMLQSISWSRVPSLEMIHTLVLAIQSGNYLCKRREGDACVASDESSHWTCFLISLGKPPYEKKKTTKMNSWNRYTRQDWIPKGTTVQRYIQLSYVSGGFGLQTVATRQGIYNRWHRPWKKWSDSCAVAIRLLWLHRIPKRRRGLQMPFVLNISYSWYIVFWP